MASWHLLAAGVTGAGHVAATAAATLVQVQITTPAPDADRIVMPDVTRWARAGLIVQWGDDGAVWGEWSIHYDYQVIRLDVANVPVAWYDYYISAGVVVSILDYA